MMSSGLAPDAVTARPVSIRDRVRAFRHASSLRWLGWPMTYAVGTVVLTIMSIGTLLLAPRLLAPSAFGSFTLLTTLFQYTGKSDLGLSQLADREIAVHGHTVDGGRASEILYARWALSFFVIVMVMPVIVAIDLINNRLPVFDTMLAMAGGAMGMVSNGPVTIYRAGSKVWEFTATALLLQTGMTAPRLLGLVVGGITGCFAVLLVWFGTCAILLARPSRITSMRPATILSMLRTSLPLFLFSALWLVYLTGNRWISAWLSSPDEFGLFAFGANLAFIAVGMLATISQVRYPLLIGLITHAPAGDKSAVIEREARLLSLLLGGSVAIAIPLVEPIIRYAFPHYEGAASATRILAISCVSLGVVAWIIPIAISLSPKPRAHATAVFVPAGAILILAMVLGDRAAGSRSEEIAGQAWGCAVAGLALLTMLAVLMHQLKILNTAAAARLIGIQFALFIGLSLLENPVVQDHGRVVAVARSAEQSMPPSGWRVAFEDQFDTLRLWGSEGGVWEPYYPWGSRNNETNRELQYYIDPRPGGDAPALAPLQPFAIENQSLVIRAMPVPPALQGATKKFRYASGMLTTARSFAFTYGYAEMRARVPPGQGLWPAFWLIPLDRTWPPEIDVMEVLGHRTSEYWVTSHSKINGKPAYVQYLVKTPDLSADYHTYAVKWTAEEIAWYFDGRRVASTPTPAGMHKPMYLVVNLAIGGGWAGPPDSSTQFPAQFHVSHIRVFRPVSLDSAGPGG